MCFLVPRSLLFPPNDIVEFCKSRIAKASTWTLIGLQSKALVRPFLLRFSPWSLFHLQYSQNLLLLPGLEQSSNFFGPGCLWHYRQILSCILNLYTYCNVWFSELITLAFSDLESWYQCVVTTTWLLLVRICKSIFHESVIPQVIEALLQW